MKRLIIVSCFICFLLSCNTQSNSITKDDKAIISKIIDEFSYPTPPPPPVGTNDTIISSKTIDSLLEVKMKIAIYPLMESLLDEQGSYKVSKKFKDLIDISIQPKEIKNVKGISSKKGHSLKLADTIGLNEGYDFKEFDLLFNFSRIWYSKNRSKAIFELGISSSRLNGYSTIFCLEKIEGEWSIIETVSTSTW